MASQEISLNDSQYAVRRRELLELLKKLRASGAQDDLDLPRIAVIGNQSAGKSSVVEAISGITVPRDAGTCTRCPMECRMTSSDKPWSCSISIRREYDRKGNRLPKVREMAFGKAILKEDEVEMQLRRAQVAVLNPELSYSDVKKAHSVEELAELNSDKTLKFSRNTICIDLTGPGLVDLAFVDLPGIIQNAEPDMIQLVEDMVVDHIRGQCIILVALPMTDDIENQRAMRLAKQEDPKGTRTIGVLTKPDMLGSGDTKTRNLWLDIIEGRREPLLHGYYCTKQPDDAQRAANISTAEIRQAEELFFAKTHPWASSSQKERFGVPQLVNTLGNLLVGFINSTLPKIRSDAALKLERCTRELANLPVEVDAEPATYMLTLINTFSSAVNKYVEGGGVGNNGVIHQSRAAYVDLKAAIRSTAPNFVPVPRSKARKGTADEISKAQPMYLDEMKAHIDSCISRELPNNVPYSAKEVLIVQFQSTWPDHVEACFNSVRSTVQEMLEKHVKATFSRYENLEDRIRGFVAEIVNKHYDNCLAVLRPILSVEQSPYTQNTHYLSESTDKWHTIYKGIRSGKQPLQKKRKVVVETSSKSQPFVFSTACSTKAAPASKSKAKAATQKPLQPTPATPKPGLSSSSSSSANPMFGSSSTLSAQSSSGSTTTTSAFGGFGSGSSAFGSTPSSGSSVFSFGAPSTSRLPASPSPFSFGRTPKAQNMASPEIQEVKKARDTPKRPRSHSSADEEEAPQEVHTVHDSDSEDDDREPRSLQEDSGYGDQDMSQQGSNDMPDAERTAKVNQLLASLAELGYHGVKEENLAKLVEADKYERELAAMAEVRGYFQIAYKRIIDNVPNLIDCLFVKPIGQDIAPSLITMLSLGTQDANDRCAVYLAESPAILKKRAELTAQKHRLEEVKQALQAFGLS